MENENVLNEPSAFENMTSKEQKEKLENIMAQIKLLHRQEVISAAYEIVDISYNVLQSGKIVYDITLTDPENNGNFIHEYYGETDNQLSKIELKSDEELEKYELAGFDTTAIRDEQKEIRELPNNPNKISLNELHEQEKELEETAKDLGISKDEIAMYSKIDGNSDLSLDANKVTGIKSQEIDGNSFVSTHYTMNDVVGMQFKSYIIVKNLAGRPSVYGISEDNTLTRIDDNILTPTNASSMSLVKSNGDIKNVGVVASFKVNVKGSELNSDQAIGLYNDNGRVGGFYARGNLTADKMIGAEVPCDTYSNYTNRTREMLDTRSNQDITHEANSVATRVEVNNDNIQNVKDGGNNMNAQLDIDELADRIVAKYPSIDKDELMNSFYKKAYNDETGKDDYELMREATEELIKEDLDHDNDNNNTNDAPTAPFSPWSNTPRPRM